MEQLRLDKLIAAAGSYSRREVKELLRQGRILVNGKTARAPEEKVCPETAEILLDGRPVQYRRYTYVMLHKPAGLLSATEDRGCKTVLDLLPPPLRRQGLFPVGRLDKDAEGLLLLSNNGALAHALLSPRRHVDKVYYVRVEGVLTPEDRQRFARGIRLGDDLLCLPARLEPLEEGRAALVTVQEGKFHQVKRMLAACGKPVTYLKRLSMGPLQLDPALEKGCWRYLTPREEAALEEVAAGEGAFIKNGENRL